MRVALITFCQKNGRRDNTIIEKLSKSSTSCGNQVDVFNGYEDLLNTRLTIYDYIAVVVKKQSFFGSKLPKRISEFLATSGSVSGKKGCALVIKYGFSSGKTCRVLMKILESEGIKLDYFDIIRDEDHADSVGKKIG